MKVQSRKTTFGMWLFTALAAGFFAVDTRGAYFHWKELSEIWPKHAMFHAVTGLFYTQILCVMIIVLTWTLLKEGRKLGWWTVGAMGLGIHVGHVIGDELTHHGLSDAQAAQGPGQIFFAGTLIALGLYVVALILTHSHVADRGENASQ